MQYRTYDPDQMRFLQMDPRADKYPGVSPYAYAGNNPLKFIDARGDTLDVGGIGGGKRALSYIHSMFDEGTAKRITMGDGGRVSFDTEGLDLSQDSGLELLNNLVNGPGMFLFEIAKATTAVVRETVIGQNRVAGTTIDVDVLKFSKLGIQSYSRIPRNVDGGVGSSGFLPKHGYDGQVTMAPGYWTLKGGVTTAPIGDVTFHELSEIYHRTIGVMPYSRTDGSGAHRQALKDAERYKNQAVSPEKLREGVTFHLEP